jgi:hypothetical protein
MRILSIAFIAVAIAGCVQPGTPIPEHRVQGLPEGFPDSFPIHLDFSVAGPAQRLDWSHGDYFVVKFTTDLKLVDIHYYFRKKLVDELGYQIAKELGTPGEGGYIVLHKDNIDAEIAIGKEKDVSTILLRLKVAKDRRRQ